LLGNLWGQTAVDAALSEADAENSEKAKVKLQPWLIFYDFLLC